MSKIKLGQQVKDKITGFTGTAIERVERLNGSICYCISPKGSEREMKNAEYIDHARLEIVPGKSPTGFDYLNEPPK